MSDRRRPDRVSLVAGAAVIALGVLALLAETGAITLQFDYAAPAALAAVGVILLVSGLDRS